MTNILAIANMPLLVWFLIGALHSAIPGDESVGRIRNVLRDWHFSKKSTFAVYGIVHTCFLRSMRTDSQYAQKRAGVYLGMYGVSLLCRPVTPSVIDRRLLTTTGFLALTYDSKRPTPSNCIEVMVSSQIWWTLIVIKSKLLVPEI